MNLASSSFVILGVHSVEDTESCFLIEVELKEPLSSDDWGRITQAIPSLPQESWQVPYDERPLDPEGRHWAFFFHGIEFDRPLLTPYGPVLVPAPTPRPPHLQHILYEEP